MKKLKELGLIFLSIIIGYYILKIVFSFFGFLIGILNIIIFGAIIAWVVYRVVKNKERK